VVLSREEIARLWPKFTGLRRLIARGTKRIASWKLTPLVSRTVLTTFRKTAAKASGETGLRARADWDGFRIGEPSCGTRE
jgi:hypothetical protein